MNEFDIRLLADCLRKLCLIIDHLSDQLDDVLDRMDDIYHASEGIQSQLDNLHVGVSIYE